MEAAGKDQTISTSGLMPKHLPESELKDGKLLSKPRWWKHSSVSWLLKVTFAIAGVVMGLLHVLSVVNTCLLIPGFLLVKLHSYAIALGFFLSFSNIVLLVMGLVLAVKGRWKRALIFIPVISPILAGISSLAGESKEAAVAELTMAALYDLPTAMIGESPNFM